MLRKSKIRHKPKTNVMKAEPMWNARERNEVAEFIRSQHKTMIFEAANTEPIENAYK